MQPGAENKVCRLKKAIYGLRQGSSAWNKILNKVLIVLGFKRCEKDQCVYIFTDRTYVYGPIIVPVVGIIQALNTTHRA